MVQIKTLILVAFLIGACGAFPAENVKEDPLLPLARQAGGNIAEAFLTMAKPLLEKLTNRFNSIFKPNGSLKKPDEGFETYVMHIPKEPVNSVHEKPVNEQRSFGSSEEKVLIEPNVEQQNKH